MLHNKEDQTVHCSFLQYISSFEIKTMISFYVFIVPFDPGIFLCIANYLNGHQLAYCLLSYINVLDIEKQPDVFNNQQQMLGDAFTNSIFHCTRA